jgi:hypothetical protein
MNHNMYHERTPVDIYSTGDNLQIAVAEWSEKLVRTKETRAHQTKNTKAAPLHRLYGAP